MALKFRVLLLVMVSVLVAAQTSQPNPAGISQTVHNLSVTGPGVVKSGSDVGVCIFCHAPHGIQPKTSLWNKQLPADYQLLYNSSTYKQGINPISDRSKLCLSCHDGTIALGQTIATGDLGIAKTIGSQHPENLLGTNLAVDHPISFNVPVQDDGEIADWLRTGAASPDAAIQTFDGKVECTTCHDPHTQDNDAIAKKFLVRSNQNGAICTNCHDGTRGDLAGYLQSQHAQAGNSVSTSMKLAYPTVGTNACMSCHTSHNAANSGPRLLRGVEEATCFTCHSSPSAAGLDPTGNPVPDIQMVLTSRTYKHPVMSVSGVHDPAETLPVNSGRHSECEDCHNPHVAKSATSTSANVPPALQAALLGSHGVSETDGSPMPVAKNEYQVCFKCHAGSTNKPQKFGFDQAFGRTVLRQSQTALGFVDQYNTAKEFQTTYSRHNVTQLPSSYNPPSLRPVMKDLKGGDTTRSPFSGYIYCSDCHNSDDARSDGGASASGPHASSWEHLLERQYQMNLPLQADGTTNRIGYSSGPGGPYALCDKCHDLDNKLINAGDTMFGLHKTHVVDGGVSCSSCHASHGVQVNTGGGHNGLVDIDTAMAKKLDGTPITAGDVVIDTANRTCSLVCHGHTHNAATYPQH